MTSAEIDSLIDFVCNSIGTKEIRSFVDRKRADLHAMVAAAIASQELPQPATKGDRVNWYEPAVTGGIKRVSGLVWSIERDGLLVIRRADGGISKLTAAQAGQVIRGATTSPPPEDLPESMRFRKAIITSEEALAEAHAESQKQRDNWLDVIHVGDKKPTPEVPTHDLLFEYQLFYKGIFGRNRTEKSGSAELYKRIPRTTPKSLNDLMPRIREILGKPDMFTKPGVDLVLVVKEYPVELDGGFERMAITDGRELYRGMRSQLLKTEI